MFSCFVSDIASVDRRLQGLLQGRPPEDRLATDGGTEETVSDTVARCHVSQSFTVSFLLYRPVFVSVMSKVSVKNILPLF